MSNVLRVIASLDQADSTTIVNDSTNVACFDTTDRLLNGSLCLLDSTTKHGPLSPAFTFAGLTVEYRLQLNVTSGPTQFSFYTPPIILETEPENSPPTYTSVVTT